MAAVGAVLLRRSRLGRYAFAIGGNAEAARLSGVPVRARHGHRLPAHRPCSPRVAGLVAAARTNGVTPGQRGPARASCT